MEANNPTTVRLNKNMQKIKDELSPVYGLKNILSAGILIFSKLSAEDREKAIAETKSKNIEITKLPASEIRTVRDVFKKIVKEAKEQKQHQIELPRMIIQISPGDEQGWKELEDMVGIKLKKTKRG